MPDIELTVELPRLDVTFDQYRNKLQLLAEMALHKWTTLAQDNLLATSTDYINGLSPVMYDGNWATIQLSGWLPNAIENGLAPFDMKPGLLHGPHAKMGPKGPYNTVPFRHGTPGTTGRNVGAPMPITHYARTGKAASSVYTAAKKLAPSVEGTGGKTKWDESTGDFGGLGRRSMLPVEGGRPGHYTWKHSPYEGIYKIAKTYAKAVQNQYISFRRVSNNSDDNAWWHPGIEARHFVNQVRDYILEQMRSM